MRVGFSRFEKYVFSLITFLVSQISQKLEIAGSLGSELKLLINKKIFYFDDNRSSLWLISFKWSDIRDFFGL